MNSLSITYGRSALAVRVGGVCAVADRGGPHVVWRLGWRLVGGDTGQVGSRGSVVVLDTGGVPGSRIRGWAWVRSRWGLGLRWLRGVVWLTPMWPVVRRRLTRGVRWVIPPGRREQLRVRLAVTAAAGGACRCRPRRLLIAA
ncbi:MAG: hypothetical protein NT146_17375 [Mycobacterium sp.]|nr:hypothetical protein [Mycobacterium sp.]